MIRVVQHIWCYAPQICHDHTAENAFAESAESFSGQGFREKIATLVFARNGVNPYWKLHIQMFGVKCVVRIICERIASQCGMRATNPQLSHCALYSTPVYTLRVTQPRMI